MTFEHKKMATLGFYPPLLTKLGIANLSTFDTEVIIVPGIQQAGGGFQPAPLHVRPTHYKITVRVKFNGRWYEDTQIVDESQARVIADLKGIKNFQTNNVMVSVNGIQIMESEKVTITANRVP